VTGASREDQARLLKSHFLFGKLRDEDIAELLAHSRTVSFRAGEEIFAKEDAGQSMIAVLQGSVRISAPSPTGSEIVFNIINAGGIFGEIALLDGGSRTAGAKALIDCELMILYRRDFMPLLARRADICIVLLEVLCTRLRQTSQQVEDLSFGDIGLRVAKALLGLAQNAHVQLTEPTSAVVRITQQELGNLVGGTRESVNRYLQSWQRAGFVKLGKSMISICDRTALEQLILNGSA